MANTLPQSNDANNPFRRLWDLGFHRLVPVIPPGVEVDDRSKIAARMRAGEDPRGKVPGIRHKDGRWGGMQFVAMESQEQDLDTWNAMGASVGVKTGQGLVAIDIDTTDRVAAELIYKLAQQHLGKACVRFGRSPKCLMLYQAPEDTPYRKVSFSTETETRAAVEMLTEGRQFVAIGTHPGTGKPYRWHENIIPERKAITQVQHADLDAFFSAVAAALPNAKAHASADDRNAPDQESLQAPSFERLEQLVRAMPNTSAMFPDRESYVKVAYAIKGATPDGYELAAQDLFLDWCEKWQGPNGETNDPDIALADWQRAKPPYRTGVRFLERHAVDLWFSPVEPDEVDDMFGAVEAAQQAPRRRFELLTDEQLQKMPDPKWLIGRHIPETGFGILFGDPGTYKSFLALDMGLSIAAGFKDWYGDQIAEDAGAVLYIAGEGSGAFKLRIQAWKKQNWLQDEMIPADRFRVVTAALNFMRHEDIAELLAVVEASGLKRIALIIIDTVSRAIPGADENKQQDMSIFVKACDTLRDRTGAFILGIHHAAKSGDMRGSSVIPGGGDAIFRVERKKGQNYVRLTCTKQKDAPDQWHDTYRLNLVSLGGEASSLAPVRVEEQEAEEAVCTEEIKAEIFAAIERDALAGNHWSTASQSRAAGRKHAAHEIAVGWDVAEDVAAQWLDMWMTGPEPELQMVVVDTRMKRRGLVVVDRPIMDGVFG